MSPRGPICKASLAEMAILCAHRNGTSRFAMIGYIKIGEATGIYRDRIRSAISILIEHGFIRVEQGKLADRHVNTPNRYVILGL